MYLEQFLNPSDNETTKIHNSVHSLVTSIIPLSGSLGVENINLINNETLNDDIILESAKEFANNILSSQKDKLEINKINEEIENDLKSAFLCESISIDEALESRNYYKLYRDKNETFECKISVEGTSLINSSIRLVLETESWNILFFGKIYKDGRCVVPLKKMTIFSEGTVGKARLEVVIDEMIFIPWEDTFIVEGSKKVTVEIKPQSKISVNLKEND